MPQQFVAMVAQDMGGVQGRLDHVVARFFTKYGIQEEDLLDAAEALDILLKSGTLTVRLVMSPLDGQLPQIVALLSFQQKNVEEPYSTDPFAGRPRKYGM